MAVFELGGLSRFKNGAKGGLKMYFCRHRTL